jgi:NAD(P)-dependent dehydrogenase (short-subunit alcohol dehydrogenase family)
MVSPQPGNKVKVSVQPIFSNDSELTTPKATPSSRQNKLLRSNATYILIGGTGGLGRSMAKWMVSKGAKNIVLVSRSGSATGKVKALIDDLALGGANIVVRQCDVVNSDSVENLIANELVGMPEIRGVVHGAMVLHVSFLPLHQYTH